MKRSYLLTVSLIFFLYGSAAAQQSFLVVHDDKNDPCRRFKMRVLVPVGLNSFNPSEKKSLGAIDYKIRVWNPCFQNEPQIALSMPSPTIPDVRTSIFSRKGLRVRFPFLEDGQKKSVGFFQAKPSWFWELKRYQR
jgi:hypothetical protein